MLLTMIGTIADVVGNAQLRQRQRRAVVQAQLAGVRGVEAVP